MRYPWSRGAVGESEKSPPGTFLENLVNFLTNHGQFLVNFSTISNCGGSKIEKFSSQEILIEWKKKKSEFFPISPFSTNPIPSLRRRANA